MSARITVMPDAQQHVTLPSMVTKSTSLTFAQEREKGRLACWREGDSPAAGHGLRRRARAAPHPSAFPAAAAAAAVRGAQRPARQGTPPKNAAVRPASALALTWCSGQARQNQQSNPQHTLMTVTPRYILPLSNFAGSTTP
jgi:hypothetical protein